MSGSTTTPTRGSSAGAAYAAENAVPSRAVRVSVPRSATSPDRGGAGGRLSWSWHMPAGLPAPCPVRAPGAGLLEGGHRRGVAAEELGRDLPAHAGQPLVLPVCLRDQPVEEDLVDPGIDLGSNPERLEPAALAADAGGQELELEQVRQRRPA